MRTAIFIVFLTAVAGCNTIAGVGEDISGGAHKVGNMMN